jgi:DNA modification methylase
MSTDIAAFVEAHYDPTPKIPAATSNAGPSNTILLGDCVQILPHLAARSVNFVLTDPPYLARYRGRDGRGVPNDDNDRWLKPAFAELYRVLADDTFAVSFYGWPHVDKFVAAWRAAGFRIVGHFPFPKRYTSKTRLVRYQHECAYLLAKGDPKEPAHVIGDVIDWTYRGNTLHPTQKPLGVLLPLAEAFSAPGGLVPDPFAGSGSSLAAAKLRRRAWLGIELDAGYHAAASQRLQTEQLRPAG